MENWIFKEMKDNLVEEEREMGKVRCYFFLEVGRVRL